MTNRWVQTGLGIVCMIMMANLQFGWTVFVEPLHERMGWTVAAIQWAFTIFVVVETWLVPFEALLVDRFGPRAVVTCGGALAAAGWVIDGNAHALGGLYLGAVVSGLGVGMVYATCVPNTVRWFARHRGLAAGLTVAGFGAGAAITVTPLAISVHDAGPFATFTTFGLVQGLVTIGCGLFLVRPPRATPVAEQRRVRVLHGTRDVAPGETARSPVFWTMYVIFTLVAAGGITLSVASLGPIAAAFHVGKAPLHVAFWVLPVLLLTLQLNNVVGGIARPVLGWISDNVGREKTLAVAFAVEALAVFAFGRYGRTPVSFVLLAACVSFAWGEIYSIFPSLTRDHFGQRYAATNYGMLYTAKGLGSFLVPFAATIVAMTKSWTTVVDIVVALDLIAAVLTIGLLLPLRKREIAHSRVRDPDLATGIAEALPS